MRIFQ